MELGVNGYFQKLNFEVIDTYEIDVIHGNSWTKSIGTFAMNFDKNYIAFEQESKKITLQGINLGFSLLANSGQN